MANELGLFALGGSNYPLPTNSGLSTLQLMDPTIYYLLDFNAFVLQYYAGALWTATTAAVGRSDLGNIVTTKIPYSPDPYLQDTSWQFPLLAMYRVKYDRVFEKTVSMHENEGTILIQWCLPPISDSQAEQLIPFMKGVADILIDRNELGKDPHYMDGYNIGGMCGFDKCGIESVSFASFIVPDSKTQSDLVFPTVSCLFKVWERKNPVVGEYDQLTGADIEVDEVDASDGYVYANLSDIQNNNLNE